MSRKGRRKSFSMCRTKQSYESARDAQPHLDLLRITQPCDAVHAYHCPNCDAWHIGHRRRKKRR